MQLYEGIIKSWKEDKGFGFIQPDDGGKDVFIHIRDLKNTHYQPKQGDNICYKIVADKDGKMRAYDAVIKGQELSNRKSTLKKQNINLETLIILAIAILPFLFSAKLIKQQHNFIPFFTYLIVSTLTFIIYAIDKIKAQSNEWRVSESTLHLLELLGGWSGALLAQRIIKHKNKKMSFQIVFWIIIATHIFIWIYILFFNDNSLTAFCKPHKICDVNQLTNTVKRLIANLHIS